MTNERFPKQEESEQAGGQHGLHNKGGSAADPGARSKQKSGTTEPQPKSDDETPRD